MLHIEIIVLGKLKETYWAQAQTEYLKRLKPFVKLTIHELKEESFSEKDNPETIKMHEALKLQNALEKFKGALVIALDETGKQMSSLGFSTMLEGMKTSNQKPVFIIGGPLGLDASVKKLAHHTISFSLLTFTHQMMRIILLEQLYRSEMIMQRRKYHY